MQCEFCAQALPDVEPENLALLRHVQASRECNTQFGFMLENLNRSWTKTMSGG